ncbi:MAG: hypothetical protein RL198_1016 [Actinomycetota bacterium]|jgi:putative thioredoxin
MNQPFDLSKLPGAGRPIGEPMPNGSASVSGRELATVKAWLAKVDESGVRSYLELSKKLPVLLLVGKDGNTAIEGFANSLSQAIESAGGQLAGCQIDADANPNLTQALRVTSLPALFLLLDGKPSPVADSVVPPEDLAELVRQVVALANQEGFTGSVQVSQAPTQAADPRFDEAAQLIADGKLPEAEQLFQKILQERPADREARAGLGQTQLLKRLAQPATVSEGERVLLPADQLFAAGDFAAALEWLLDQFASASDDGKQQIRERLVEFFAMIGDSEPVVISARSRLASMLF